MAKGHLKTSNDKPFNFPYPTLPARPLNAKGGITGLQFNIGGIDPDLVSPVTYTYTAGLDRQLGRHLVGSFIYSGAAGRKLLSGGGGLVSTGRDYLRFCQMILQGGQLQGTQLLRKETVEQMTTNQLPKEAMPAEPDDGQQRHTLEMLERGPEITETR